MRAEILRPSSIVYAGWHLHRGVLSCYPASAGPSFPSFAINDLGQAAAVQVNSSKYDGSSIQDHAINGSGQIYWDRVYTGYFSSSSRDLAGRNLTALAVCKESPAYTINDLDQVVGECDSLAVLWRIGGVTGLGSCIATDINDHGAVVVIPL